MKRLSIEGHRYGKLTVNKFADIYNGKTRWVCFCDCGAICIKQGVLLRNGRTKSCGCLQVCVMQKVINANKKHGLSEKSRLYTIWKGIIYRCTNKIRPEYKNYGGRGITICKEWSENFINFYNWANLNGYTDKLIIDRINNNGDYSPGNCRWVSMVINANNTRRNVCSGIEELTLAELSRKLKISYDTLWFRFKRGDRGDRLCRPIELQYKRR